MKRFLKYIIISLILVSQNTICDASDKHDRMVLSKVWYYSSQIDTTENISLHEYAYHKFLIKTQKRNFTLLAVPSMYNVAHGSSRKFVRELYDEVDIKNLNTYETKRIIDFNTTPHRSKAMTNLQKYMTPKMEVVMLAYNSALLSASSGETSGVTIPTDSSEELPDKD